MKILVVSYMYPNPTNEILGIFVEEQVKALVEKGCEVKVIAPVPHCPFPFYIMKKAWRKYPKIPFLEIRSGIEVYHPRYITTAPSFTTKTLLHLHGWLIYRAIKNLAREIISEFKPDIIHAHGAFPLGYAIYLLKKDLTISVKSAITAHGGDIHSAPFSSSLIRNKTILSVRNNDLLIAVSQDLKDIAESLLSETKIKVIPNGVDIRKFTLSSEDNNWIKQKKGYFKERKILLFVGSVMESKGIKELLEAFDRVSSNRDNLLLILIGRMTRKDYIDHHIKSLNGNIRLLGPVKHERLKLWMNLCDMFLLPSYNEGLPVSMLEAMACGKPVIVSDVGGISEVVRDKENGLLIEPKDVDSLVKAINFLLDNPDKARELGEKAKRVIFENYTWIKNAERTIDVYREILESKSDHKLEKNINVREL